MSVLEEWGGGKWGRSLVRNTEIKLNLNAKIKNQVKILGPVFENKESEVHIKII